MTCRHLLLVVLSGLMAANLAAPAGARAPSRTVTLVDIAFVPAQLTLARGTVVRWHWSSANFEHHRLVLVHGPRGAGRISSHGAVKNATFTRRLTRSGTYRFVCSYHPGTMRQTIIVR